MNIRLHSDEHTTTPSCAPHDKYDTINIDSSSTSWNSDSNVDFALE